MKHFVIFSLLTILGCATKNKEQTPKEEYQTLVSRELASGFKNDTIFLGFTFGMSEQEYRYKQSLLLGTQIIYFNPESHLAYTMTLPDEAIPNDTEAIFIPDFFEQKLYKLNVYVKSKTINVSSTPVLKQAQLARLYQRKYGEVIIFKEGTEDMRFVFVKGSMQVEILAGFDYAEVIYTDLIADKKRQHNLSKEQENKESKTRSNI